MSNELRQNIKLPENNVIANVTAPGTIAPIDSAKFNISCISCECNHKFIERN